MLTQTWDTSAECTIALLLHYIFDLSGYNARELVERWLSYYPANWVRLAVIEALYQGRYKAISVEQILGFWQRRGQAWPRFNCEFERLVCGNIQPRLTKQSDRYLTANPYPPALKPSVSNSHDTQRSDTAKAEAAISQPKPVQIINITAKVVPEIKQTSTVSSQNKHRQFSSNDHRSHMRSFPRALPSSVSQQPIQQFNPEKTKASDFYTKLKAISRHN